MTLHNCFGWFNGCSQATFFWVTMWMDVLKILYPSCRWADISVLLTILDVHFWRVLSIYLYIYIYIFFLYDLYLRNDFPSVGQVGTEAGACKAGGESHFGQGAHCDYVLRTYCRTSQSCQRSASDCSWILPIQKKYYALCTQWLQIWREVHD